MKNNDKIRILSLFFILRYYKESLEHKKQKIDWAGAITLVVSIVGLMFALELGGKTYDWNSVQIIGLFAVFAVFFIAFFIVERKAEEPIISFWMFKNRLLSARSSNHTFFRRAQERTSDRQWKPPA